MIAAPFCAQRLVLPNGSVLSCFAHSMLPDADRMRLSAEQRLAALEASLASLTVTVTNEQNERLKQENAVLKAELRAARRAPAVGLPVHAVPPAGQQPASPGLRATAHSPVQRFSVGSPVTYTGSRSAFVDKGSPGTVQAVFDKKLRCEFVKRDGALHVAAFSPQSLAPRDNRPCTPL